mmetsp:Transcript_131/g.260  ORF Transcript_131/g.260 Transcript_131/m.260 type:complete len:543 (+) Transcript_131:1-1629(+)
MTSWPQYTAWIFCVTPRHLDFLPATLSCRRAVDMALSLWDGNLLDAVQRGRIFADGKEFVDMPARFTAQEVLTAFSRLPEGTADAEDALARMVSENFDPAGSDLEDLEPEDWVAHPDGFLPHLSPGGDLKRWALHVHALWRQLSKRVRLPVGAEPSQHTLLPLPHPFQVPGSRFREMYYWDNLWVVRGLLVSGMHTSASHIAANMLTMVERHGFMPNGTRSYYLNRSQPPLLSQIVQEVHAAAPDRRLLRRALPALRREHELFTSGARSVSVRDSATGETHALSRYHADWRAPRPESYREDVDTAQAAAGRPAEKVYCDIASAAESGWDFSSRWFEDGENLHSIRTTRVAPADLNAFLYQMERNIADIAAALGECGTAAEFEAAADRRRAAIHALMWDGERGRWEDLLLEEEGSGSGGGVWTAARSSRGVYASSFAPLWCGCAADEAQAAAACRGLRDSGLLKPGGVATSLSASGQQWDGDNGWPCLQSMIVEGLRRHAGAEGRKLADSIAQRWLRNNYLGVAAVPGVYHHAQHAYPSNAEP